MLCCCVAVSTSARGEMIDQKAKKRFEPILAEFRRGIAYRRSNGATEEQIRQILGASIWLVVQEVKDPKLRAWLCDEFGKVAKLAPVVTSHPASRMLH